MKRQAETSYGILQDSIVNHSDSLKEINTSEILLSDDTLAIPKSHLQPSEEDSISNNIIPGLKTDTFIQKKIKQNDRIVESPRKIIIKEKPDNGLNIKEKTINTRVPDRYNFADSIKSKFDYKPVKTFITVKGDKNSRAKHFFLKEYNNQQFQLNWSLIIGMISIILLLSLKRYYQKFIIQVVTTLVNYQLAEKMLREKNIIVRRAFFILNLNFVLILSLFFLTLTIFWGFKITENYIYDYLIILGIVVTIIFTRLILLYVTGILFGTQQAINEHIHICYLINKSLGLIMLPIVFIILYTSSKISEIAIYFCLGMLVIATFYKIFRGFQIIIRNGVFIFYAFLYLCTLELLPLVIGSKLIISLR